MTTPGGRRRFPRPTPSIAVSVLALVIALGGTGLAATGGTFVLGWANSATTGTALRADVGGAALRLENTGRGGRATGLEVITGADRPPLTVSSRTRVAGLRADLLDGTDASGLLEAGSFITPNICGTDTPFPQECVGVDVVLPRAGRLLLQSAGYWRTYELDDSEDASDDPTLVTGRCTMAVDGTAFGAPITVGEQSASGNAVHTLFEPASVAITGVSPVLTAGAHHASLRCFALDDYIDFLNMGITATLVDDGAAQPAAPEGSAMPLGEPKQ